MKPIEVEAHLSSYLPRVARMTKWGAQRSGVEEPLPSSHQEPKLKLLIGRGYFNGSIHAAAPP